MGWEWRIVYEGDHRKGFAEHTAGHLLRVGEPGETEERQDMYVVVSNSVGAKLRGDETTAGGIEVKRRQERKKRGAELWEKNFLARQGTGTSESDVISDVVALLPATDFEAGGQPSAVTLAKSRVMYRVPQRTNGKKGAKVECTLIRVVPVGGGRGGRVLTSVCVETKDAKKIYDAVDLLGLDSFEAGSRWTTESGDSSRADDWMGRSVIGYPEICSRIASGK